jgi:hypothetical protein
MSREYITLYQIVKEMFLEDFPEYSNINEFDKADHRRGEWLDKFNNYKSDKIKYFKEILQNQGVNPDIKYKNNGDFQIPLDEKEAIKLLIKEYTSSYYKKLRKGEIPDFKATEEIVNKGEKLIYSNFEGNEAEKQVASLHRATQYYSKKASKEVLERLTELISKSINNVKMEMEKINGKEIIKNNKKIASYKSKDDEVNDYKESADIPKMKHRVLLDEDVACLIYYYEEILTNATKEWNKIADIYDELRGLEVEDAIDLENEMLESEDYAYNSDVNYLSHKAPKEILEESIKIMAEEKLEKSKYKKKTPVEVKRIEADIRSIGEELKRNKPNKN